jgi:hypothetical protein
VALLLRFYKECETRDRKSVKDGVTTSRPADFGSCRLRVLCEFSLRWSSSRSQIDPTCLEGRSAELNRCASG